MVSAIRYQPDKTDRMTTCAGSRPLGFSAERVRSCAYKYNNRNRLTSIYGDTGTTRIPAFSKHVQAR